MENIHVNYFEFAQVVQMLFTDFVILANLFGKVVPFKETFLSLLSLPPPPPPPLKDFDL